MPFNSPMIDHPTVPAGELKPRYVNIVNGDPNEMIVNYYRRTGPEPVAQLTADHTTQLLLNMNGANNSTSFVDSSTFNRTVTRVGSPVISTTQSKFGEASGYFNGSSYLTVNVTGGLNGAGDFTLEFWYYKTADSGFLFNSRSGDTPDGVDIRHDLYMTTQNSVLMGAVTIPLNTWTHVVIMRTNGTIYRLLNGILNTSVYVINNFSGTLFRIGANNATSNAMTGYIDDFRVSNAGRYVTNAVADSTAEGTVQYKFYNPKKNGELIIGTTVNAGLTTAQLYVGVKPLDSFWQYDTLVANMNGANNSKILRDNSISNSPIRRYGDAKIVTTTGVSNGSSLYLDGASDYLVLNNSVVNFGTGNFTFEFWINALTVAGTAPYFFASSPYNTAGGFIIYLPGPGTVWGGTDRIYFQSSTSGAAGPDMASTSSFKNQGWKHVAITRNGSTFRLFVNGVQEATATNSTANFTGVSGYNAWVGVAPSGTGGAIDGNTFFKGNIDLFRVTKGACRYTANFTAPTVYEYLKWKKASQALQYINTATGQTYDPNWLLYSNLAP